MAEIPIFVGNFFIFQEKLALVSSQVKEKKKEEEPYFLLKIFYFFTEKLTHVSFLVKEKKRGRRRIRSLSVDW